MLFDQKRSSFNDKHSQPTKHKGIVHLFANDLQLVLVLEEDCPQKGLSFVASSINLLDKPLDFAASQQLQIPQTFNKFPAIKNLTDDSERLCSIPLSAEERKEMHDVLTKDIKHFVGKDMESSKCRASYLTNLFSTHKKLSNISKQLIEAVTPNEVVERP